MDWPVPYIQFYFYNEPMVRRLSLRLLFLHFRPQANSFPPLMYTNLQINFSLQFGEQKFRWFAQVVSNKIKQFLIQQIVYPNGFTYHFTQKGQDWHAQTKLQFPSIGEALNQPGTLILHAHSAEGINEKGTFYCQVKIGKQKGITKSTKLPPTWNETLFFDLRKVNLADSERFLLLCLFPEVEQDSVWGYIFSSQTCSRSKLRTLSRQGASRW